MSEGVDCSVSIVGAGAVRAVIEPIGFNWNYGSIWTEWYCNNEHPADIGQVD